MVVQCHLSEASISSLTSLYASGKVRGGFLFFMYWKEATEGGLRTKLQSCWYWNSLPDSMAFPYLRLGFGQFKYAFLILCNPLGLTVWGLGSLVGFIFCLFCCPLPKLSLHKNMINENFQQNQETLNFHTTFKAKLLQKFNWNFFIKVLSQTNRICKHYPFTFTCYDLSQLLILFHTL